MLQDFFLTRKMRCAKGNCASLRERELRAARFVKVNYVLRTSLKHASLRFAKVNYALRASCRTVNFRCPKSTSTKRSVVRINAAKRSVLSRNEVKRAFA